MNGATTVAVQKPSAPKRYAQDEIDRMSAEELMKAYKETGEEELKWQLVLRYERLVRGTALQIRGVFSSFAQLDDIIQEGVFMLLDAIDHFDPNRGNTFETYVFKKIRGMVMDLARKHDWVPRNTRRRKREFDRACTELGGMLGRDPTEEELARYLGITLERYRKEASSAVLDNILSMDTFLSNWQNTPCSDVKALPEPAYQERELLEVLSAGIRGLQKNEQMVLSLYYEKNARMKDIALILGVSVPRVSQLHTRAIEKLRTYMTTAYIEETQSKTNV